MKCVHSPALRLEYVGRIFIFDEWFPVFKCTRCKLCTITLTTPLAIIEDTIVWL